MLVIKNYCTRTRQTHLMLYCKSRTYSECSILKIYLKVKWCFILVLSLLSRIFQSYGNLIFSGKGCNIWLLIGSLWAERGLQPAIWAMDFAIKSEILLVWPHLILKTYAGLSEFSYNFPCEYNWNTTFHIISSNFNRR